MASLLQSFWNLSSFEEEERLMAASNLLEELKNSQESESFEQELIYCTNRLITGLASNRKGARHGYFTALCELLGCYSQYITTESVFKIIRDKLECIGNVKASEERGSYIGQLFALLAIVQSKRKLQKSDVELLVQKLIHIYMKKCPLRELCISILLQLLGELKNDSKLVHDSVLPQLVPLEDGLVSCTPDVLLLLVTLEEYFNQEVWFNEYIKEKWCESGQLLSKDNFDKITPILLLSSQSHPRVHSIWPHLFERLRGTNKWAEFWSIVIEGSLLKSTRERKFLVFQLIEKYVLPDMGVADVGVVINTTLFQTLHTCTRAVQHSLYESSMQLLNQVIQCSLSSAEVCVGVWLQLIKTNLFPEYVSQLQSKLSSEGVTLFVNHLTRGTSPLNNNVQLILEHITYLLKHLPGDLKQSDWLTGLADYLIIKLYFDWTTSSRTCTDMLSVEESEICKVKLIHIMNELVKLNKLNNESVQDMWSVSIATRIKELISNNELLFKNVLSCEEKEVWLEAIELVNTMKEKTDGVVVFCYLISVLSLEMIWERENSLNTLQELIQCYNQMNVKKTPSKRKRSPQWIEMLIDILLSLLSKHEQLWTTLVNKCFPLLVPYVNHEAFQLIVKALEPQDIEDLMGHKDEGKEEKEMKIRKTEKEDEEEEGDGDGEGEEDGKGEGERDGEEEDEEDMEGGMQFHDPGAEFIASVRNALGDVAAVDSDQESIMSIDEEQMESLDEALSAIFRKKLEKAEEKKQKKINQVTMMQFKMRILQLIESFIKHHYSNPLALSLVKPLFLLSVAYQNHKTLSSLSDRATPILEKLCKTKKFAKEGVDTGPLLSFTEQLLTEQLYKEEGTCLHYLPSGEWTDSETEYSSCTSSVSSLSSDGVVYGLQPYMFEPEASDSISSECSDEDSSDDSRLNNTNWCTCGHCVIMPTTVECVCCCEIEEVINTKNTLLLGHPPVQCITEHPGFNTVCLNKWVLETAYNEYSQSYGSSTGGISQETLRYIAHRQLAIWCWEWLGEHITVVLPSCAVNKIKETFPL